jgi:hypothetical protein
LTRPVLTLPKQPEWGKDGSAYQSCGLYAVSSSANYAVPSHVQFLPAFPLLGLRERFEDEGQPGQSWRIQRKEKDKNCNGGYLQEISHSRLVAKRSLIATRILYRRAMAIHSTSPLQRLPWGALYLWIAASLFAASHHAMAEPAQEDIGLIWFETTKTVADALTCPDGMDVAEIREAAIGRIASILELPNYIVTKAFDNEVQTRRASWNMRCDSVFHGKHVSEIDGSILQKRLRR